jgi:hypothetical protein
MHWALPNSTCCTGMELTPRDAIPYTISHVHRRKLTEPQAIYKPSLGGHYCRTYPVLLDCQLSSGTAGHC